MVTTEAFGEHHIQLKITLNREAAFELLRTLTRTLTPSEPAANGGPQNTAEASAANGGPQDTASVDTASASAAKGGPQDTT